MAAVEVPQTLEYMGGQLNVAPVKNTRSSHECLNDLEEEYQASALLAKSKRFFKKGTQRFSSAKATDQTEFHKCGKKELRPTKDFEAKYNKVKAKLALLSSSTSASKATTVKNKGLIMEAYEWDEEEVSSDDNEMVEVKVLMALAEEKDIVSKEGARNGEWVTISMRKKRILGANQLTEDPSSSGQKDLVFVKSSADDTKVSIPGVERPWLSEAKGFILPNHDTGRILPIESQRNTTDPPVVVTNSSVTDYDSADESFVCSTLLPLLKKCERTDHKTCDHAEYISTINMSQHLKSLGRSSSRSKIPRPSKRFFPPCIHYGCIDHLSNECLYYPICGLCGSYDHETNGHNRIISLEREINSRNSQHAFKRCEAYGSSTHTMTNYDIKWFRRGEALQAKKAEALKSTKAESSNTNRSKTPTKRVTCTNMWNNQELRWCLEMTLHAQLKVMALSNVMFDEKRRTIFNSNKEVVMIAPRDKPCSSCENRNHYRASFTTKQTSSIKKCLHLFHMDLFGPVTPRSINHEKYTLVIVDEYSRDFSKCSSPYTPEQNGVAERKNRTLIEAARTMLSGSAFSKQYWTKAVATACYTQNRSTIVKRHLKTPYEIFRKKILNINFLHVFGCLVYIYNHKDHLGKFDEKADDGYLLGYSLVSKAFGVFNTRRQQIEETYHITFDESPNAIKFSKPSVDDINIAKTKRYPPDEYLHPYEPSQMYQANSNDVTFIEPYKCPEPVVLETEVLSDENGQTNQNDQSAQTDEILNDDHIEDTSLHNTIPIPNSSLSIPSMVTLAPQDRWSQDKHIKLVNIIGNLGAGMLTIAMAKELSAALTHECHFVDFLSEEEPKKVFEALQHPG
ncbi:retrovirus-related pol polyprotein from transposon TNT 1-94 [Tanacetum coccineum]